MDRPRPGRPGRLTADDAVGLDELLPRCRFPAPGTRVTCGVSGGPDSTALLVLAAAAGCEVTAVHVDHGLRPGSAAEGEVVERTATRVGAAYRQVTARVARGPNLEARARAARHAALPPATLLGHTADDQAETVLVNLLRGAGLDGIAAIRPDDRHPILALRRAETGSLCGRLGLDVVADPSNDDPAFVRNRIRHQVLPLLDDVADRDVIPLLCRLASHAREAVDHLDGEAATLDVIDARALAARPTGARPSCDPGLAPLDVNGVPPTRRGERRARARGGPRRAGRDGGGRRMAGGAPGGCPAARAAGARFAGQRVA